MKHNINGEEIYVARDNMVRGHNFRECNSSARFHQTCQIRFIWTGFSFAPYIYDRLQLIYIVNVCCCFH